MNAPPLHPAGCLSDLALDRIAAEDEPRRNAHLDGCERCRSRLGLFAAVGAAPVARRTLESASARAAKRQPWPFVRLPLAIAGACAAAALVFLAVRPTPPRPSDEVRIKGTSVAFFRQRGGEVTHGVSGESFLPGDALRFVVSSGSPGYFFLVGVEPSGNVVAYHPYGGTKSAEIAVGREIALPGSLVLDESKGVEYFGGLFSREPLRLEEIRGAVQAALARGSPLPVEGVDLPAAQHWIVIRKP